MEPQSQLTTPFKVFGLQRTGTNLMQRLMLDNFRVRYLPESTTGWKHGAPLPSCFSSDGQATRFILCIKNPYAWLISCYRYFRRAYDHDRSIAPEFLRDPTQTFEEFVWSPSYEFNSPIHRWNIVNRCWLMTLPPSLTVIVRHEDQLVDQLSALERIEGHGKLSRRGEALHATDRRIEVNACPLGEMNGSYYRLREYMREFSPSLLTCVNQMLDRSLMQIFNYQFETSCLLSRSIGSISLLVRARNGDGASLSAIDGDSYQCKRIKEASKELKGIIDVGSQVGAFLLHARTLWPNVPVVAYESEPDAFRVLLLNCRDMKNASLFCGMGTAVKNSTAAEADWDLAEALTRVERVDLLRIGKPNAVLPIVAVNARVLPRIKWIIGELAASKTEREHQVVALSQFHKVSELVSAERIYFQAERRASDGG